MGLTEKMKKLLLIIALLYGTVGQSQFLSMLGEDVTWFESVYLYNEGYYTSHYYFTDGDTIINNEIYYKLYGPIINSNSALIKQDEDGKIFVRFLEDWGGCSYTEEGNLTADTNHLLMDFSAHFGDTVQLLPSLSVEIINESTVEIDGADRIALGFNSIETDYDYFGTWVEGIGNLSGLFSSWCDQYQATVSLECYKVVDEVIYGACNVGINESQNVDFGLKIYPIPTSEKLFIEVNEGIQLKSIQIYSVIGEKVMIPNTHLNAPITIDVSNLKSGVYLIEVIDNDGFRDVNRFIVE